MPLDGTDVHSPQEGSMGKNELRTQFPGVIVLLADEFVLQNDDLNNTPVNYQ